MTTPRSALFWHVYERLCAGSLDAGAATLLEAAFDGDGALDAALASGAARAEAGVAPAAVAPVPVRTWLVGLEVEGFRGIGPTVALEFVPGPGLTLVVGRNGTGKSSLSEALEVVLTGANRRWTDRPKEWRDGWRNLHHAASTRVVARFATEGSEPTSLTRVWAEGGELGASTLDVTRSGGALSAEALGWDQALTTHRPLLSYAELGKMIDDGPSKLYDALESLLGLGELTAVHERLGVARRARAKEKTEVGKLAKALVDEARALDDDRARTVVSALGVKRPVLDAVDAVLDAAPLDHAPLARAAALVGPSREAVAVAVAALREAVQASAALAGAAVSRERDTIELIEAALRWHGSHGDDACPVCSDGALDANWREKSATAVATYRAQSEASDAARRTLERVVRDARALVSAPPATLVDAEALGLGAASELWRAWAARPDDALALADHMDAHAGPLADAVEAIAREARARVDLREGRWRPLALKLAAWRERARRVAAAEATVTALEAAEKWLVDIEDELRAARFAPIKQRAQAIWETLRQESSVQLADIALEGAKTRRHVDIAVAIDGHGAGALGVMSQGELNALALSLFIPRLVHDESPFRFVVIDDPVQAMDPFKVDGLARVLSETAKDRQVIVLTHDARLEEAVRRMRIPATVLEVVRNTSSRVAVRQKLAPVQQHLDDAHAIWKEAPKLGDKVVRRVVPGMCRSALEAAFVEVVRRNRLSRGVAFDEVAQALDEVRTLHELAALAFFDDVERGIDVYAHTNREYGARAVDLMKALKSGAHEGTAGDIKGMIDDTFHFAQRVRSRA